MIYVLGVYSRLYLAQSLKPNTSTIHVFQSFLRRSVRYVLEDLVMMQLTRYFGTSRPH